MTNTPAEQDPWSTLNRWTDARIALGRAGTSLPTAPLLEFQLAHARARDAVLTSCDFAAVKQTAVDLGLGALEVRSRIRDRAEYLRRPDLGRLLDDPSERTLAEYPKPSQGWDVALVVGDGLSSQAIEAQGPGLIAVLVPLLKNKGYTVAPVVCARQARVALGDEVGARLDAALTIVLIGERPGLSSPDSLGAYLTWAPRRGLQNADRNCVSNIRPAGLPFETAAQTLVNLVRGAFLQRLSGVALKEDTYLEGPR